MSASDPITAFQAEVENNIEALQADEAIQETSSRWLRQTHDLRYEYNFTWLGRPVLQLPQDILALQEIVWRVQPDLIIETGVAHGGSVVFFASLLEMLGGDGEVLGIDLEVREHNRREIRNHPLSRRIRLLEGSSTDAAVVAQAAEFVSRHQRVLVVLDSDHTEAHVLEELRNYAPFVTAGSYLVVCDTSIETLDADAFPDRDWGPGNSPGSAVSRFLTETDRFEVDTRIDAKLLLSNSPGGYLKCRS